MARAWMAWGLLAGLGIGCGPDGETAAATEGDTETGTGASTGDAGMTAASVSASSPMTTASSNSADGADDAMTTAMMTTGSPDPDSSTGPVADEGTDAAPCPPGTADCPCDVGSTCDEGLECVRGTCLEPAACEEPEGEPNDDEPSAIEAGDLSCGGDPVVIEGALDGTDADWFTMNPIAGVVCFDDPTATVTNEAKADIAVCIFAVCNEGGTNVGCGFGPGAGTPESSPEGADGCCGTGSVSLDSVSCQAIDQSYTAWVRVSAAQDECLAYELTLEY